MTRHVHADIIEAYISGKSIEVLDVRGNWEYCEAPIFARTSSYRVVPSPPPLREYAKKILQALADGKTLQTKSRIEWEDWDASYVPYPITPGHVRIKPEVVEIEGNVYVGNGEIVCWNPSIVASSCRSKRKAKVTIEYLE